MPILKVSEQLQKLSRDGGMEFRIPAPVQPQDMADCPACGDPEWNGAICSICGHVGDQEIADVSQYFKNVASKRRRPARCSNCSSIGERGDKCSQCGHPLPPEELRDLDKSVVGLDPTMEVRRWEDPRKKNPRKKKTKGKARTKRESAKQTTPDLSSLGKVEADPTTVITNMLEEPKKQGDDVSRFDELNERDAAVNGVIYDQTSNMNLDGPFGLSSQAPAPVAEAWKNIYPEKFLNVQDLDDPDVAGGPGSNAVYVKTPIDQRPMQAKDPYELVPTGTMAMASTRQADMGADAAYLAMLQQQQADGTTEDGESDGVVANKRGLAVEYPGVEEKLYKVYEASRDLRNALKQGGAVEFDSIKFKLDEVKNDYKAGAGRVANRSKIGEVKTLVKIAEKIEENFDLGIGSKATREALKDLESRLANLSVYATNGNQETDTHDDVRDLDGTNPIFDRQRAMTPDSQQNVVVPNAQPNQLALADVPDHYNDGGETGYGLAYNYHREPWPNDPTNPALQGYMGLEFQQAPAQMAAPAKAAAVQEARERILESIELVDRLERLGMVNSEDKAKHIAKFEQMDTAKLAGFKASIDMLEETGARQPRSQKVASDNNNRMPEMGRMTTASTLSRQDVLADDFLMTLN